MRIDNMLALVKDTARDVPGVYRMTSAEGEVIYVGKSKALRTRLLSYFRAKFPQDKGARILREAATLEWEPLPNEFAALLRELRLIKQLRPRYNVAMKRDARYHAFVRISRGPAPRLHVVRGDGTDDAYVFFGPVDVRLRPFCETHVGKVYSRAEIAELDNKQLPNAFLTGGGYNCRHVWMRVPTASDWYALRGTGARVPVLEAAMAHTEAVRRTKALWRTKAA
jgi:hypothetical protein